MAPERQQKTTKKRKKRSTKQHVAELAIEARRAKAAKLTLAGWSQRDIAAHLKCSLGTVNADVSAAFARVRDTADGAAERAKAISLARLDVATKGIWAGIEAGDLEAVDRLVKIETRRAKLEGLDEPIKQELSGVVGIGEPSPAAAAELVRKKFGGHAAKRDPGETPQDPPVVPGGSPET